MKAAVIHSFTQAPAYEDIADPTPQPHEALIRVRAVGIHPVVRGLASGQHYGSTPVFPQIPGIDGVGQLDDGTRVYFGMVRDPYGTLAELAAAPRQMCLPLPDSLDDATAAALFNPGLSAWLALRNRAQVAKGETVLILGATGAGGRLAVQIAKHLGAGRVIAAGRDPQALALLPALGADAVISLDQPRPALAQAIAEAGAQGIHVIIDYLWGTPAEAAIDAITRRDLTHHAPRVRLVEVGSMAGATISLPAAVLRSSGLEILGSGAGTLPPEQIAREIAPFMDMAASGGLSIATRTAPLSEVGAAWAQASDARQRLVLLP